MILLSRFILTSSVGMSDDCISSSQNSTEIRKEAKKGKEHDAFSLLRKQRLDYPKNVIFGHLNIKSLWNKFGSISKLIKGTVDIFLINETKLDKPFSSNQFGMSGSKFLWKDKNKFGVGTAFSIKNQVPSWTKKFENPSDIKILTIEIIIRKNKILFAGIYKPSRLTETDFNTRLETFLGKL